MNEKEYVKIEVGTFYRFVQFLRYFVSVSGMKRDTADSLRSMIDDFENEVIDELYGET